MKPRTCTECRHSFGRIGTDTFYMQCNREGMKNPVDGRRIGPYCRSERLNGGCGMDGEFFEKEPSFPLSFWLALTALMGVGLLFAVA